MIINPSSDKEIMLMQYKVTSSDQNCPTIVYLISRELKSTDNDYVILMRQLHR